MSVISVTPLGKIGVTAMLNLFLMILLGVASVVSKHSVNLDLYPLTSKGNLSVAKGYPLAVNRNPSEATVFPSDAEVFPSGANGNTLAVNLFTSVPLFSLFAVHSGLCCAEVFPFGANGKPLAVNGNPSEANMFLSEANVYPSAVNGYPVALSVDQV